MAGRVDLPDREQARLRQQRVLLRAERFHPRVQRTGVVLRAARLSQHAVRRQHGLVAGGYKAIDSLRLEKGYRVWGADITPDDTPHEAGLGFAVRDDKDFLGRAALEDRGAPERRLRCLVLADPSSVALGSEPVRVGDALVGRVTSGGYGYTVGSSIAYAYLPAEHEVGTEVAVEIFGEWVGGEVTAEPLFDPAGERIRA